MPDHSRKIVMAALRNLCAPDGMRTIWIQDLRDDVVRYIKQLEQERDQLKAAVSLAIDAFHKYEMDVDTYPTVDHVRMMTQLNRVLAEHDAHVIKQTYEDAYKAGFNHGLKCDKSEIEKLNGTYSGIRMFDYQIEHYIRDAAERYLRQKAQENQ